MCPDGEWNPQRFGIKDYPPTEPLAKPSNIFSKNKRTRALNPDIDFHLSPTFSPGGTRQTQVQLNPSQGPYFVPALKKSCPKSCLHISPPLHILVIPSLPAWAQMAPPQRFLLITFLSLFIFFCNCVCLSILFPVHSIRAGPCLFCYCCVPSR